MPALVADEGIYARWLNVNSITGTSMATHKGFATKLAPIGGKL